MKNQRGMCTICARMNPLRKDGTIGKHKPDTKYTKVENVCDGTGQLPFTPYYGNTGT